MHFPEMNNDQKRDLFAECLLDTQGYTFNEKNTAAFYRERDPTSLEKPEEKKALLTLMSELISTLGSKSEEKWQKNMDLVLLLITDNTIPLPTGPVYSQDILFKHSKYTRTPVKDIYPEVIERLIIHDPDTERGHEGSISDIRTLVFNVALPSSYKKIIEQSNMLDIKKDALQNAITQYGKKQQDTTL